MPKIDQIPLATTGVCLKFLISYVLSTMFWIWKNLSSETNPIPKIPEDSSCLWEESRDSDKILLFQMYHSVHEIRENSSNSKKKKIITFEAFPEQVKFLRTAFLGEPLVYLPLIPLGVISGSSLKVPPGVSSEHLEFLQKFF